MADAPTQDEQRLRVDGAGPGPSPLLPVPSARRRAPVLAVALAVASLVVAAVGALRSGGSADHPLDLPIVEAPARRSPEAFSPDPLEAGWQRLVLPGAGAVGAVAYGEAGWAATSACSGIWTSADGAAWVWRPGPADAPTPSAVAVGRERAVVAGSSPEAFVRTLDPATSAWTAWTPAERGGVEGVAATAQGVVVFGWVDGGSGERAVVWREGESGWEAMDIEPDPGARSTVAAVVEAGGVLRAFGRTATGPAAWVSEGGRWVELGVETPLDSPAWGFGPVVVSTDGKGYALARTLSGRSHRVLVSTDLLAWRHVEERSVPANGLVALGERPVGFMRSPILWTTAAGGWQTVMADWGKGGDRDGPWVSGGAADLDGQALVLGGTDAGRPVLWTWGLGAAGPPQASGAGCGGEAAGG